MKILHYKEPFYHTIVENFYTPDEEKLVWQELDFLHQPGKLLSPEYTGDPDASPNKMGLFLDNLYGKNRQVSNILSLNRKIFYLYKESIYNPFLKYLDICDKDLTMISYYGNDSYYKPHHDMFVISSVTLFWKHPRKYTGGNLVFTEYGYVPNMQHNTTIIFPSFEKHCVSTVKTSDDLQSGRYTINQFFTFTPHDINN